MKYRELFEFAPLRDAVRLQDGDSPESARRLVAGYAISPQMGGCLRSVVFPSLALDRPADARALWVVGPHGVGKSHLLSFISILAGHADFAEAVTTPSLVQADKAGQNPRQAGLESIAGRFKVVRVELGAGAKSLSDAIAGQIQERFVSWGIACPCSADVAGKSPGAVFEEIMAAFHNQFPEQGFLLVVDDLLEHLARRSEPELTADLDFLEAAGKACRRLRFRFVVGADKDLLEHPGGSLPTSRLHRILEGFAVAAIGASEACFVISQRMAHKTPAQKARIGQHLGRFARFYGGMPERLNEYVDAFPLHPDYFGMVGRIPFVRERALLRTASEAIEQLLDKEVPENGPGLIAYDHYWDRLRSDAALREVLEIDAVVDFGRSLEEKVEQSLPHPDQKGLALRLIHALCIHRLATGDIYNRQGATVAELRDTLCLHQPELTDFSGQPSAALEFRIAMVLDEVRTAVGEHHLSFDPESGQYRLQLPRFRRFVRPELMLHWANAVPFVLLMLTGGAMVASRFFALDRRLVLQVETLHKICALVWVTALPLVFLLRPRVHRRNIRDLSKWGKEDLLWFVHSIRGLYNKKVAPRPAARFNTGQKMNACLVLLYFFSFAATGALMFFAGSILLPWYAHTALFFAALGSVGGHLYLSLVNPSTRIALTGIFHGWSPMEYVKHHHPLSLPPSQRTHLAPTHLRTTREELFLSRMEILSLALALTLAGVGSCIFANSQLASAKRGFAKSFADCIKPDVLSTKHRVGPLLESCTKCHSYTGLIPNANCEQCHAIVKERRIAQLGYHGTLKGDCITCHKEHQHATASIIPLDQKKFDHDLTAFKRQGKHAQVECNECHQKKRPAGAPGIYYMGLKYGSCADCHREPHNGQFTARCEQCHSANGWHGKDVKFTHETESSFKLAGKHASLDCVKCHKPTPGQGLGTARFKGLSRECAGCHEDPHRKQFAAKCDTCHQPAAWKGESLAFKHNQESKFALSGKHLAVACEKCHVPKEPGERLATAQFHGLPTECADCHQDPHRNQFGRSCLKCHTPAAWKRPDLVFQHNQDSKFALLAKHAQVACEKCHVPVSPGAALGTAQFRDLRSACPDCHKDPHRGQFELACTKCHVTPTGWSTNQLHFEHNRDTKFGLAGKHSRTECQKCHKPQPAGGPLASAVFRGLETGCEACHKVNHPEVYGRTCVSCHDTRRWPKKQGAEHILAVKADGEPLAGKHLTAECKACHVESRMATLGQTQLPWFGCDTCHQKEEPHKGTLGTHCTKCHDLEGWKGEHLLFNHDTMTRYALNQDHKHVACAKCHKNQQWKPLDDRCQSCHPKYFQNSGK